MRFFLKFLAFSRVVLRNSLISGGAPGPAVAHSSMSNTEAVMPSALASPSSSTSSSQERSPARVVRLAARLITREGVSERLSPRARTRCSFIGVSSFASTCRGGTEGEITGDFTHRLSLGDLGFGDCLARLAAGSWSSPLVWPAREAVAACDDGDGDDDNSFATGAAFLHG